mmetsp:Transcript_73750/g.159626  ORF Transcript_73750/g.159626 Transcript_73750/m.159626 type:complete len:283 (+) Transcript_73750:512-1360(+)
MSSSLLALCLVSAAASDPELLVCHSARSSLCISSCRFRFNSAAAASSLWRSRASSVARSAWSLRSLPASNSLRSSSLRAFRRVSCLRSSSWCSSSATLVSSSWTILSWSFFSWNCSSTTARSSHSRRALASLYRSSFPGISKNAQSFSGPSAVTTCPRTVVLTFWPQMVTTVFGSSPRFSCVPGVERLPVLRLPLLLSRSTTGAGMAPPTRLKVEAGHFLEESRLDGGCIGAARPLSGRPAPLPRASEPISSSPSCSSEASSQREPAARPRLARTGHCTLSG